MSEFQSEVVVAPVISGHADAAISDLIAAHANAPWMSIEFFPPKTPEGVASLYEVLEKLKVYRPLFSDVTWGAGGSTSELTLEICKEIKRRGVVPQLHLTCTNMDAEKVFEALEGCKQAGITNLLALRGDPPAGESVWHSKGENLTCALDLIKVISAKHPDTFCIGCACYPEGHPTKMVAIEGGVESLSATEALRYSREVDEEGKESIYVCRDADFAEELLYLKQKVDAGASYCITQMFFDAEVYKFFVEACRAIGITVPIIPGIMVRTLKKMHIHPTPIIATHTNTHTTHTIQVNLKLRGLQKDDQVLQDTCAQARRGGYRSNQG